MKVAGSTFTQSDPQGIQFVDVQDHVDMVGSAEIQFGGKAAVDWSSLKIGSDVEVEIGGETSHKVFKGYIAAVRHQFARGQNTISVRALCPLCKLQASRKTRIWEDSKDSDAISSVIGDSPVSKGTVDSTPEKRKYIMQRNESDLRFVRRMAARNGYLVTSADGKVNVAKPQYSGSSIELPKNHIISLNYTFTDRLVPPKITVYGWDYVAKEMVEGSASDSDVNKIGTGDGAVKNSGKIWQKDSYLSDVQVTSQAEAKALAGHELNRLARSFLRGMAVVQGNGALHAGALVCFKEQEKGFNPEAFVVSSRHRIVVEQGMTTEISFVSNTWPVGSDTAGAAASDTPVAGGAAAPATTTTSAQTDALSPASDAGASG